MFVPEYESLYQGAKRSRNHLSIVYRARRGRTVISRGRKCSAKLTSGGPDRTVGRHERLIGRGLESWIGRLAWAEPAHLSSI
jgi:hypothetical protein